MLDLLSVFRAEKGEIGDCIHEGGDILLTNCFHIGELRQVLEKETDCHCKS